MAETFTAALANHSYFTPAQSLNPAFANNYTNNPKSGMRLSIFMPSKPPGAYDYKGGQRTTYPGMTVVFECSGWNVSVDTYVKDGAVLTNDSDYRYQLVKHGFPVCVAQVTVPDTQIGTPATASLAADTTWGAGATGTLTCTAGFFTGMGTPMLLELVKGGVTAVVKVTAHDDDNEATVTFMEAIDVTYQGGGNADEVRYGQTALLGRAMYHAPGGQDRRWEKPFFPNAVTNAIEAFQYVRMHRKQLAALCGAVALWEDNYCVAGTSAGAHLASMLALCPDWAYSRGSEGRHIVPTVPNCALLMATNVGVTTAWADTVTFFDNLPRAETGANAEVACQTLRGTNPAVERYIHEFAPWTNMAGRGGNSIPYTLAWSDKAYTAPVINQAGGVSDWGEPFSQTTGWPDVAHTPEALIAQQAAHPKRFLLSVKTQWNLLAGAGFANDGEWQRLAHEWAFDDDAYLGGVAEDGDLPGTAVKFVREHIMDLVWDRDPKILSEGITRRGQVEKIGRFIVPYNPLRKFTRIFNTGREDLVGPASDEHLFVGRGRYRTIAQVPLPGTTGAASWVDIPGTAPIYAWSDDAGSTDYAKFGLCEVY